MTFTYKLEIFNLSLIPTFYFVVLKFMSSMSPLSNVANVVVFTLNLIFVADVINTADTPSVGKTQTVLTLSDVSLSDAGESFFFFFFFFL